MEFLELAVLFHSLMTKEDDTAEFIVSAPLNEVFRKILGNSLSGAEAMIVLASLVKWRNRNLNFEKRSRSHHYQVN